MKKVDDDLDDEEEFKVNSGQNSVINVVSIIDENINESFAKNQLTMT